MTTPGGGTRSSARHLAFLAAGLGILFTAATVAFLWSAFGSAQEAGPSRGLPSTGPLPAELEKDPSPEARAFQATCSQCHMLPSPVLYDGAGWQVIRNKMAAQIATRGLEISDTQLDLAIAYLVRHGR